MSRDAGIRAPLGSRSAPAPWNGESLVTGSLCGRSLRRPERAGARLLLSAAALAAMLCATGAARGAGEGEGQGDNEDEDLARVYGDANVVQIATGAPVVLRRAPSIASVITAQEMADHATRTLEDALESVPGLHVSRSNLIFAPAYFIRGIVSDLNPHVLVLMNGVPMISSFTGNRSLSWTDQPIAGLSRIEVIRGPGSALYGADAFAGVINLVTRPAGEGPTFEAGGRVGSLQTQESWLRWSGSAGDVKVAAYLHGGGTAGVHGRYDADAQTGLDAAFGTHASLAPGRGEYTQYHGVDGDLDLSWGRLRLHGSYRVRDDIGSGGGVAGAIDPVGRVKYAHYGGDLAWSDVPLAPDWRLTVNASATEQDDVATTPLQLFPPGATFPSGTFPEGMFGGPDRWERQGRASAMLAWSGLSSHAVRLGVGHDDLNLFRTRETKNFSFVPSGPLAGLPQPTSDGQTVVFPVDQSYMQPHRRTITYAWVQDEWHLARDWTLTAGVRRDRFSDFGDTTNPRAALVWEASLNLTVRLMYGSAFRAPSFTELYSINNPIFVGNPALKPERIRTFEQAVTWQAGRDLQVDAGVFEYTMRDLISTAPNANGEVEYENVGEQEGRGVELEARWSVTPRWRVVANYALQRSVAELTHTDAGYAPHHHAVGRVEWTIAEGWLATLQANHVSARMRAAGDARPALAGYTTADLSLVARGEGERWQVDAAVRNLFDADVREPTFPSTGIPHDLPMAGRTFTLGATLRF